MSRAGIACHTLSMVLAMIVVAAMAIANVTVTTTLEPGDVRSVRIACRIEITRASAWSKPVPARCANQVEFPQLFDGCDSAPSLAVRAWDGMSEIGSRFQVPGSGFVFRVRVQGSAFRVRGSGFAVRGYPTRSNNPTPNAERRTQNLEP